MVSVRTRFEVFKRDRFTCGYCGRTPPSVLLQVDHIVPRAAGGSDDEANLATSCQDCNAGKSSGLLEEGSTPVVSREVLDELQDRIEQAKAYAELLQTVRSLQNDQYHAVVREWARAFEARSEERDGGTYWVFDEGRFPEERSVRSILRRLSLERVLEAIDITAGRWDTPRLSTCRYFYGVCWRMIKEGDP